MNLPFTKYVGILILALISQSLYSQNPDIVKGYCVTFSGDSLAGQLHLGSIRQGILLYRPTPKEPWETLEPKGIKVAVGEKGVYILNQEIRTQEESQFIFVQKIVDGHFNLYKGYTSNKDALYFLEVPGNKSLIKINQLGYKAQLNVLLKDCALNENSRNLQYNTASLSRYIIKVNQCASPNEKPLKFGGKIKPSLGIGVKAFYYSITPEVTPKVDEPTYFSGNYPTINRLGGGLSVKININPSFSINTGVNYIDKRIKSDSMVSILAYTKDVPGIPPTKTSNFYKYALDLNFKYLEIPLGFSQTFLPYNKLSPIVSFGFTWQLPIVSKVESDWGYPVCPCNLPTGEIAHISPTWVSLDKRQLISFFGSFGLKKSLNNKNELELRLEYYHQYEEAEVGINKIAPKSVPANMKTRRFQLSFNYFFTLKNKPDDQSINN